MYLEKGAVFVGDVHYHPKLREEFLEFVDRIETPQLFLMGDIFDLLVGGVDSTLEQNGHLVTALRELSRKTPCFYLEGNHDFLLKEIFPDMRVVSRFEQPLVLKSQNRKIALSHGDIFIGGLYRFYIESLNTPWVIKALNRLDPFFGIAQKIQRYNKEKNLCKRIENFEILAKKRLDMIDADIVIEGHYHQRCICDFGQKRYINLPAFACAREYLLFNGDFSFARM